MLPLFPLQPVPLGNPVKPGLAAVCQERLVIFDGKNPWPMEQTHAASLRCQREGVQSKALALQIIARFSIIHGLCRQFVHRILQAKFLEA